MKPVTLTLIEKTRIAPAMWQFIFSSGEPVPVFQPGQFFLARTDNMFTAYLSRPFFLSPCDGTNNNQPTVRFQLTLSARHLTDRGLAWLFSCPPARQIEAFGPLGHGFVLPSAVKNLLIAVDFDYVCWLFLVMDLFTTRSSVNVTLTVAGPSLPSTILHRIPPHVEIVTALTDYHLRWPDAVIALGSIPFYRQLRTRLTETRLRLSPGLAQVVLTDAPFHICGVGACGLCAIPTTAGPRLACRAGPVFDLATLDLEALSDD